MDKEKCSNCFDGMSCKFSEWKNRAIWSEEHYPPIIAPNCMTQSEYDNIMGFSCAQEP